MGGGPANEAAVEPLTARIKPGYLGTVNLARPLLIELVVVLALAALTQPLWILAVVLVLGLVLVVLALARADGRWWTERVAIRSSLRRRRRTGPDRTEDPRLGALRVLAPGLRIADVPGTDGSRLGVGVDPAGWFAAAVVLTGSGSPGGNSVGLPFDRLAGLVGESGQPGAVLQVVVRTTSAPSSTLDARQRCVTSYRELLDRYGPVPANQLVWIAVRLDASELAASGIGAAEAARQAPVAVAALARRVQRALSRSGTPIALLDREGLLDALTEACDLGTGDPDGSVKEQWRVWATSRLAHTCYWIRRWPAPGEIGAFLHALAGTPAAATTVAVMLEPGGEGIELRCLVRLSAPVDSLPAAADALAEAARRAGAALVRLDGEHGLAVYATAPTGGGAR
jgi:ESX secretion system protein EccE